MLRSSSYLTHSSSTWSASAKLVATAGPSRCLRFPLATCSSDLSRPLFARSFASTTPRDARVDHYGTLKLPRNASRQQIKAKFYELSKKMHPDAPGGSAEAFHAINDAYAVLGNESARAAYDRSHTPASQRAHGGFRPHSPESRRASGPHAAWGGRPPPGAHWTGRRKADPNLGGGMGMGSGPASGAGGRYGRKAGHSPGAAARQRRETTRLDEEVSGESQMWRFVVMTVVLLVVISIGGGFTVSAADVGTEDTEEDRVTLDADLLD